MTAKVRLVDDPLRGKPRATPNAGAFRRLSGAEKQARLDGFRNFIENHCPSVDDYLADKRREARREAERYG